MVTPFLLLMYRIQLSFGQLTCTAGQDCIINCDTPQACNNGQTINCIDGYDCKINCNARDACTSMNIKCNHAINCQLTCDGTVTDRPCLGIALNGQNAANLTLISQCGGVTDDTQCAASTIVHCPQNPLGTGSCNIHCLTGTSCNGISINGLNTGSLQLISKGQTSSVDNLINVYVYCPSTKNCHIYGETGGLSLNGVQIHTPNPGDFSFFNIQCIGGGTCFDDSGILLNCGSTTCQIDPVTLNSCDGDELATNCDVPMTYALGTGSKTWSDAETYCASTYTDGHLASIRGADEFSILQTLVGSSQVWIGLNDRQLEDNWVWSDGTQCVANDCKTYTYWKSGDPNGGTLENCASYMNANMYYQDDGCDNMYQFVCNKGTRIITPTLFPTAAPATPTTSNPTTLNPTTLTPTTFTPTTSLPTTNNPTTLTPTTSIPTTSTPTTSQPTTNNPTTSNPTTNQPAMHQTSQPVTAIPSTANPTDTPINDGQIDTLTTDGERGDKINVASTSNNGITVIIIILVAIIVILLVGILLFYFKPCKKIRNEKKSDMNVKNAEMNKINHQKVNIGDDDIVTQVNQTNMRTVKKWDDDVVAQINRTDCGNNERHDDAVIAAVNGTDMGHGGVNVNNVYNFETNDDLDDIRNDEDDEEDIIHTINYKTGGNQNEPYNDIVDTMEENGVGESEGINYKLNQEGAKEVKLWLDSIGFSMYYDILTQNGFDSMESIQEITDKSDLNDVGITLKGHQLKLIKYIKMSSTH